MLKVTIPFLLIHITCWRTNITTSTIIILIINIMIKMMMVEAVIFVRQQVIGIKRNGIVTLSMKIAQAFSKDMVMILSNYLKKRELIQFFLVLSLYMKQVTELPVG